VENSHTVPSIETLEKMARALEIPMYQLFYDSEEPPKLPNLPRRKPSNEMVWGSEGKDARLLSKFRRLLGKANEQDRKIILLMAQKMALRWPQILFTCQNLAGLEPCAAFLNEYFT
jgi:hypothetical protein